MLSEKEMKLVKEAFQNKSEVLLDCWCEVQPEEYFDYYGESVTAYVEVEPKDTIEKFIQRIESKKDYINAAVSKSAYYQGMSW